MVFVSSFFTFGAALPLDFNVSKNRRLGMGISFKVLLLNSISERSRTHHDPAIGSVFKCSAFNQLAVLKSTTMLL